MNRKLLKKLAAMAMVTAIGISTVACGSDGDKAGGGDFERDENGVVILDEEKEFDISYYGMWCEEYEPGCYTETLIKDNLNINVEVPRLENTEAINLMLSSGEMTDCGWYGQTPEFMYDQELVRTIPVAMVEKYAPSFLELYDEYPALYAYTLDPEDPTQFKYLTGVTFQFVDYYLGNDYYRYDWILDAGIDIGVEVEQITDNIYVAADGIEVDKFVEIMEAFVHGDPNGTGVNDTVGINAPSLRQSPFFSGFDFISGVNNVDGKAEQWYATEGYKDLIRFMADMYEKGLIDPQMITPNRNISWEMVNKEQAGYWITSTNSLNSWAIERPPLSLLRAVPDVKILMTPGLKPEGGEVRASVPFSPAYGQFYVNTNTDDEKLAKILTMIEYTMFGEDRASFFYGEEGVDWNWNEEGDMPIKINQLPSGERGTWSFSQHGQDREVTRWTSYEEMFAAGVHYWAKEHDGTWLEFQEIAYKSDIREETDYATLAADYSGEISAYTDTYFTECVLGKKDVDETWDEYLENLERLGYNELMAELDKIDTVEEILSSYE